MSYIKKFAVDLIPMMTGWYLGGLASRIGEQNPTLRIFFDIVYLTIFAVTIYRFTCETDEDYED